MSDKPTPADNAKFVREFLEGRTDIDFWKMEVEKVQAVTIIFAACYKALIDNKIDDPVAQRVAMMFALSGPYYSRIVKDIFKEYDNEIKKADKPKDQPK